MDPLSGEWSRFGVTTEIELRTRVTLLTVLRVAVILFAALVLVGCGGADPGLNADEAVNVARERAVQLSSLQTSFYGDVAVRARAPSGQDAWLVRVYSTAGSWCMYVWRKDEMNHVKADRGCAHWKSR